MGSINQARVRQHVSLVVRVNSVTLERWRALLALLASTCRLRAVVLDARPARYGPSRLCKLGAVLTRRRLGTVLLFLGASVQQYSLAGGQCQRCPVNQYSVGGAGVCTSCASGQYSLVDGSGCAACPAGQVPYQNYAGCQMCYPGTYAPAGSAQCLSCPPGRSSGSGAALCSWCPASGYFDTGSACTPCPAGTYATVGGWT